MFFAEDRIPHMRAMIMADNPADRKHALMQLLPMQRADFLGIFRAMDGFPVTIRLLDPPLHEFLPRRENLMAEVAVLEATKPKSPQAERRCTSCSRAWTICTRSIPCWGTADAAWASPIRRSRRCRRARSSRRRCWPSREGVKVYPEVMVPLICTAKEMANQGAIIRRVAEEVFRKKGIAVSNTWWEP